jgi:tetratricopeptide (TPR) repeat protein
MRRFTIPTVLALALTTGTLACQTSKDMMGDVTGSTAKTTVSVPLEDDDEWAEFEVVSANTEASRQGVRAMSLENWDEAVSNLAVAVEANPDDERSLFALGVAQEMQGDLEAALESYESLLMMVNRPAAEYTASHRRVQAKLE